MAINASMSMRHPGFKDEKRPSAVHLGLGHEEKTNPFFLKAEHCIGYVKEAPEPVDSNWGWSASLSAMIVGYRQIK